MKKIGVIGGLSWVSTAEYYRRINEMVQERLGGVHSADLVMASVDRQDYVDAVIERRDEAAAGDVVLNAARSLEAAGVDFIVISCNDAHRFVPRMEGEVSIPFLHIADATAGAIRERGQKTVALIGVRKTMEGGFYADRLSAHGIATILPEEDEKAYLHASIFDELVKDVFLDTTRARYVDLVGSLHDRGAEGVVLGCTEIPLLIVETDTEVPLYATTEIHCRAAVDMALAETS
ncbi:MAG: aspartate/glutamate racemase family protein [Rhodospirillaceae bacterium]|jgi:aspartate racemase|nr:aspartate/glutamate racemase family protein [Rhodospirillaceae bacterium]MBT6117013.1 aspartate/glutamate racemase family protein [Rhodospirillaceae bacterium]